ncbi:MAG: gliding motility-associated C-terminal domain-containing protein [Bacteroidia bacterium]|nr:gliding motility-associated C-terminal domain-containing protein [Bacteroidia bacterium]
MNNLYKVVTLILLSFLPFTIAKASHIIGGELYYRCLSKDLHLYEFGVKLYVGCTGAEFAYFDDPIYVAIYDSIENANPSSPLAPIIEFSMVLPPTDTLANNTYNLCLTAPNSICVEEALYKAQEFLPDKAGGYFMTYQRCCRNAIIANIVNPGSVGASWYLHITEDALAQCNSSPVFKNYPPTILCLDHEFVYDHSAYDSDGDSLVYELCKASSYNYITWGIVTDPSIPPSEEYSAPYLTGYNEGYPIYAPTDSMKIDPKSGILTVTPTKAGTYVVAICVSEYRKGKLLSTNKRDFQFTVVECIDDHTANFTYTPDPCVNGLVQFSDSSTGVVYVEWDFWVDTLVSDTSSELNPIYKYDKLDHDYLVKLVINDTLKCVDSITKTVTIPPAMFIGFDFVKACVFDTTTLSETSFVNQYNGAITKWEWEFGNGDTASGKNVFSVFSDSLITYLTKLKVTTENGCVDSIIDKVDYYFLPSTDAGKDTIINLGESGQLRGVGADIYLWSPAELLNTANIADPIATPIDSITYFYLLGTTNEGCEKWDTVLVNAKSPQIVIPTAFSPNGDKNNDEIYLIPLNITKLIELKIYNRWGQVVFETNDLTQGWDGNFKGEPQEIGTYAYYYIAETVTGQKKTGKGNIALLR